MTFDWVYLPHINGRISSWVRVCLDWSGVSEQSGEAGGPLCLPVH